MTKEEIFDLIIKAFGVYFLVLVIISLPKIISGMTIITYYLISFPYTNEMFEEISKSLKIAGATLSLTIILKILIYLIASIIFLRSRSLASKLVGKKKI